MTTICMISFLNGVILCRHSNVFLTSFAKTGQSVTSIFSHNYKVNSQDLVWLTFKLRSKKMADYHYEKFFSSEKSPASRTEEFLAENSPTDVLPEGK